MKSRAMMAAWGQQQRHHNEGYNPIVDQGQVYSQPDLCCPGPVMNGQKQNKSKLWAGRWVAQTCVFTCVNIVWQIKISPNLPIILPYFHRSRAMQGRKSGNPKATMPLLQGQRHHLHNSKDVCAPTTATMPLSLGKKSQLRQRQKPCASMATTPSKHGWCHQLDNKGWERQH
jgi:hypothetical protein